MKEMYDYLKADNKKRKERWERSKLYPILNPIFLILRRIRKFLKACYFRIRNFLKKNALKIKNLFWQKKKRLTQEEIGFALDQKFPLSQFRKLDIDYIEFSILFLLTIILFYTGICSSLILDTVSLNSTVIVDRASLTLGITF